MKYCFLLLTFLLLTGCTPQTPPSDTERSTETFIETARCSVDSDCTTPPGFLIQSNCPFTSLCLEGQCTVVCPLVFPTSSKSVCDQNSDCDCSARGERSLECVCSDGACYSVEG